MPIAATPVSTYEFDHWELNHHTLTPDDTTSPASRVITATDTLVAFFTPHSTSDPPIPQYDFVVAVDPPGSGKVELNPLPH